MSRNYEEILERAMALPIDERGSLAEDLLDSLQSDEERAIEREWIAVAERRLDEVESGVVKPILVEESIARARAALKNARRKPRRG
jgi:putative addiction module component (TIGR02574 family)